MVLAILKNYDTLEMIMLQCSTQASLGVGTFTYWRVVTILKQVKLDCGKIDIGEHAQRKLGATLQIAALS